MGEQKQPELKNDGIVLKYESCELSNETGWGKEIVEFNRRDYEVHDTCNLYRYFAVMGLGELDIALPPAYVPRLAILQNPESYESRLLTNFRNSNPEVAARLIQITWERLERSLAIHRGSDEEKRKSREDYEMWVKDGHARMSDEAEQKILCSMAYDFIVKNVGSLAEEFDPISICS